MNNNEEQWVTMNGHPASGLRYQEWNGQARITRNGLEVVSPSSDTDSVYRQYNGRVERAITDLS
ncbi:hypothetical protein [Streptomyces subrutilus]|uniref:hypothetical protein n=1 Tax=Streptomyces subrutilus TaxID=36818 RepID=UPI0033DB8EBA